MKVADRFQRSLAGVGIETLDQQGAVEMVDLVLEQAGFELVDLQGHLVAVEVAAHKVDGFRADYLPGQAGNRETALVVEPFALRFDDFRVHDHSRPLAHVPDEQPLLHAYLRRCEADPRRLVHGLDHVVGKAHQSAVDVIDLARLLAQDGISNNANVATGHSLRLADGITPPGATVEAVEGAHYFDQEPTVASKPAQTEVNLPDLTVTLTSDRGVFSHDRLDPGTKLLLTDAPPVDDDAVTLDIGCGWGPIACVTALRTRGGRIWAIDTNSRARTLTEINARAIGAADRITVAPPTEIPKGVRFDRILSNPPIRIGKPALHQLLESWLSRLNPGGQAHLVVQKHLGSDSLSRWLTGQGFPTIRWVSRSGYRILEVDPREDS